jgi:predicted glutamine amidotransferase
MCRLLAYRGHPIILEDLVCAPSHSLVHQSLNAREGKTATNGDGFGLGWYGERPVPGLYREIRPAWSDENLRSLCAQVRSRLFFAHIRASTYAATTRANCHPFAVDRHLFMHNGQIGGYARIRREVEALIADSLYGERHGTGDTEAIFLAALSDGLAAEPVAAMARTLDRLVGIMMRAGVEEALKFTAVYTDGASIYAYRWANRGKPPSLYYRENASQLVVVSEPYDNPCPDWHEVPAGSVLVARDGARAQVETMPVAGARATDTIAQIMA